MDSEKQSKISHPLWRLIMWHPLVAGGFLAYGVFRFITVGPTAMRYAILAMCGIWTLLAVIDFFSKHRFLNWVYGKE